MIALFEDQEINDLLVIDVGGSKIKWQRLGAFGHTVGKGELATENTERWLLHALNEIDREATPTAVLLGVPGPVKEASDLLVLPPLGITTNKQALKRCFKKAKTKIVNDAVLIAMINDRIKGGISRKGTGLSLTIGTSLGSTLMLRRNEVEVCGFIPIEMAHLRLDTKDWDWSDSKDYFEGKNASCLYSVYGLIVACGRPKTSENPSRVIHDSIVRLEKSIVKSEMEFLDQRKVSLWIKSLCSYCNRLVPDLSHIWITGKVVRMVLLRFDLLGEMPREVDGINVSIGSDLTTDQSDWEGIMMMGLEDLR